jgi:DNA-directed RNA polymerase specialized sigma24 family protein
MTQPSIRILIIGAGYAGLLFTMRLAGKVARQHVQILLVNESDSFIERVRLHQFATNQGVQWRSIPQMLRNTNVQFLQGRVTGLDPTHRKITVEDQLQTHHVEYDYLVYALGSVTDRQSVPGVAEYAYTLAARGPLSAALRETLPSVETGHGHVVVCGGGATGIETAAEVATAYPHIKVHLVTQGPLGLFLGKTVASSIRRSLTRVGVEIIDQTSVTAVHAQSVVTDQGSEMPCDLCVWTGGFVAPPLARETGLAVQAEMLESISMAFLVLLERLSPVERAVFLLREVFDYPYPEIAAMVGKEEVTCRQILSRAKKFIAAERPRFTPSTEHHHQLLRQFLDAVEEGDLDGLTGLLASDVTMWADGGGKVRGAATRSLHGPQAVARFTIASLRYIPGAFTTGITEVNGEPAILLRVDGHPFVVVSMTIVQQRIVEIRVIGNPGKLGHLE